MTGLARHWPPDLHHLLAGLQKAPTGTPGCYWAEVDVSEQELLALQLFETAARHDRVLLPSGEDGIEHRATMEPIIGLGEPHEPARHVARVRICFTHVEPE
ncbi:hypothetical protein QNA08_18665 [Chelatococcus sp. SYSU_G07232]|uniref:Uncharacterized protein n=1 Tax=Chelatococcus albus TaxID=3047466 RepID=A0ABT7AME3_9HYPH|nr:hypothetical protein [Chelatococcus sp. SYSU_G07232]MDJ1160240.1 hypothetical protein [Chelatococcus sp. SYSU_G07232]